MTAPQKELGSDASISLDAGFRDRAGRVAGCSASFQQILASLTTNPAQRFGYSTHSGHIAKGFDADLVVLDADPAQNASAFSGVRYTIRGGEVIYTQK
jgi:imidazolonepropionase-like amidohydrolase